MPSSCGVRLFAFPSLPVFFAFSLALFAAGQTAPAPASPSTRNSAPKVSPTFHVAAREVLVDALVTNKDGQPVTGLTASDFRVSEKGVTQAIRWVHEHHPMDAAATRQLASTPKLPPNTFSNFTMVRNTDASIVFLLDAMDTPVAEQMEVRQQLIDFFKHMQPGPPMAIFQLDTEVRLVQGFTSDPQVLLAAVESGRAQPSLAVPTAAPRSYTYFAVYRRTLMETLRDGMSMMGRYLAGYPGRKNLIWFTGRVPMTFWGYGFSNPFRDGLTVSDSEDETHELTDVLTLSRVAVYPVDTFGLVPPSGFSAASARSSPPRVSSGLRDFANQNNMDLIAEETGGKAYYDSNRFTSVIDDVIRTGSSYYTISYATSNTKWNGEFRPIAIAVNRPDVHVLCKKGYYAYSRVKQQQRDLAALANRQSSRPNASRSAADEPAVAPSARAQAHDAGLGVTIHHSAKGGFDAAMALGAIPPTEIVFAARLAPEMEVDKIGKHAEMPADNFLLPAWRHKPFRTDAVFFDVDVHRVRFTRTPDGMRHATIETAMVVYTPDGAQVNSLSHMLTLDVTAGQLEDMLVTGLHERLEIAIPVKGRFFLRLGVNDKIGDQMGALEIPVDQIHLETASLGNN